MNKVFKFIQHLKFAWKYDEVMQQILTLRGEVVALQNRVGEHTTVHMDISPHPKDLSQVIICGTHQNHDYVRSFTVRTNNIRELIQLVSSLERNAGIGRIDIGPSIDFSAFYERDRF